MERNGRVITDCRTLFGYPISCRLEILDAGIHVLLTGGCRTHIGAFSSAVLDGSVETRVFPGHKDHFVSEPWAKSLAAKTGQPVLVVCGIHYDNASKDEICQIMKATDEMLSDLLNCI